MIATLLLLCTIQNNHMHCESPSASCTRITFLTIQEGCHAIQSPSSPDKKQMFPYKVSMYIHHTSNDQSVLLMYHIKLVSTSITLTVTSMCCCFYHNEEKLTTVLVDNSDSPYGMLNMYQHLDPHGLRLEIKHQ